MSTRNEKNYELADVEAFSRLSNGELAELESRSRLVSISSGEILIRQGDPSDSLFLVVSGRFRVIVEGSENAITEIGQGQPIGEIGFFAGGARTANVVACRDSLVVKLAREDFELLCQRSPELWKSITVTLAKRLARSTNAHSAKDRPRPRTIALCHAGQKPVPAGVVRSILDSFRAEGTCKLFTSDMISKRFRVKSIATDTSFTRWLNDEEASTEHLLFLADPELSDWSKKAIRQADLVLRIGLHDAAGGSVAKLPNSLERFTESIHAPETQRLVLVHDNGGAIDGTRHWLDSRRVAMHHHVDRGTPSDYARLHRFIAGRAVGLVVCGGGAYCAAHVGLFQAFLDAGLEFDLIGGTSGGAAMSAAFAMGVGPEEIDRRTHEIFVVRKAMGRATWPKYSLLDHKEFDSCLADHFTGIRIEDMRLPFFAVSTDLSSNRMYCHRTGRLWRAIRASSAIPGLFPPVYRSNGAVLVDGSLLDNVPVRQMVNLKTGPNVVINLCSPAAETRYVDYAALPSRAQLARKFLLPFLTPALPDAPSARSILTRSLAVNREDFRQHLSEKDLLFTPTIPDDVSILDWQHHSRLKELAYEYGRREIARHRRDGHSLLTGNC